MKINRNPPAIPFKQLRVCLCLPLFLYTFVLLPGFCQADEFEDSLYEMSLEELLNISVVTSTKHAETLQTVPSAVTIFDEEDIHRMGIDNLLDLMNFVPGYQSYRTDRSSLGTVASSRGSRGGYAGREILILLDGVRLNEDYSGGLLDVMPAISLENAERVEFIRGPGSALYGSNAFLGVVNIITKGNNRVGVAVGNNQSRKGSLQAHWQQDDSALSLYAQTQRYDGEQLAVYDPDSSVQDVVSVHDRYRWKSMYLTAKTGGFSARLNMSEFNSDDFYVFGYVSDRFNSWDSHHYSLSLAYDHELTDHLKLALELQGTSAENDIAFLADKNSGLGLDSSADEKRLGSNVSLTYQQKDDINAIVGFEFRQPEYESEGCYFGAQNYCVELSEKSDRSIRGWYGQFQQKINATWRWIAGARYDNYSDFGSHVSPRLGLIHQIDSRNTVKLLYGQAFRAPSQTETNIKNNPVYLGNPDLEPEVATTTELIYSLLMERGFLQLTLFDVQIDDAIRDANTPPPKRRINSDEESIAGIEFEYRYRINQHWFSRGAFTYLPDTTREQQTESDTLVGVSLGWLSNGWTATLNANYQGEKSDGYSSTANTREYNALGGRTLYSTHIAYQFTSALESYLTVENLFDKNYLTPAERIDNRVGVPNSGRTFVVGVRWDY